MPSEKYYASINKKYSETSDKGHSILSAQYKNLHTKDKFLWPKSQFSYNYNPLRSGHLSIKDNICWSQGVLCIEVPLYYSFLSKISVSYHQLFVQLFLILADFLLFQTCPDLTWKWNQQWLKGAVLFLK